MEIRTINNYFLIIINLYQSMLVGGILTGGPMGPLSPLSHAHLLSARGHFKTQRENSQMGRT